MPNQPVPLVSVLEWLGQTVASGCWIASVFLYRIENGEWHRADVLQLAAASAWMVANIASLLKIDACVRCLKGKGENGLVFFCSSPSSASELQKWRS